MDELHLECLYSFSLQSPFPFVFVFLFPFSLPFQRVQGGKRGREGAGIPFLSLTGRCMRYLPPRQKMDMHMKME